MIKIILITQKLEDIVGVRPLSYIYYHRGMPQCLVHCAIPFGLVWCSVAMLASESAPCKPKVLNPTYEILL